MRRASSPRIDLAPTPHQRDRSWRTRVQRGKRTAGHATSTLPFARGRVSSTAIPSTIASRASSEGAGTASTTTFVNACSMFDRVMPAHYRHTYIAEPSPVTHEVHMSSNMAVCNRIGVNTRPLYPGMRQQSW